MPNKKTRVQRAAGAGEKRRAEALERRRSDRIRLVAALVGACRLAWDIAVKLTT